MSFRISALDRGRFARLFAMPDHELTRHRAVRRIADSKPGFPCRVSLADAEVGDELILVNYEHQGEESPYRAAHAIFVRKGVETAQPGVGEVPDLFRTRALSLRAFDHRAMMVAADLVLNGSGLAPALDRMFEQPACVSIHIHFAKFGCYAARATRA